MICSPVVEDYLDALVEGPSSDVLRIGLAVPASGVMGLTGPAGVAAAVLAAEEANDAGILRDRRVRLVPLDAGRAVPALDEQVGPLVRARILDGIVGFHTSDVHRRLERITGGRLPYLFTPPHEGGTRLPGVGLLGDGPVDQLQPVVDALARRPSLRRWALVGTDYIWPRAVHAAARRLLPAAGGRVVLDELVPFQAVDADRLLHELRCRRVQGVLLSLVGRDLATFNRAFANSGLAGHVVRASGALEETGLLEIDGDDTGELYAAMSWYASEPRGEEFADRYDARWGCDAPSLGAYARGCYDGVTAMARLAATGSLDVAHFATRVRAVVRHRRSRLARAEGLDLRVLA